MADDLVDLSETADSNTTFRGVSILGTAKGSLMDNALRSLGVMIARVIKGTKYIYDTLRIADSDDVSKVFGFDAGSIPGSTTRVLDVEELYSLTQAGLPTTGIAFLSNYISGFTLANGADIVNDIDIAAGACLDSTNAQSIVLSSGLTKRLDAAWAVGTNQGGLDAGSIANATYHLYAIKRLDTGVVDVLFSTSATSPTLPTSYTVFRRIGSIVRAGGSIVRFSQLGDEFLMSEPVRDADATQGTSSTTYALTVPTGIKVSAKLRVRGANASTWGLLVSSTDVTDSLPTATDAPGTTVAGQAGESDRATIDVRTNTSGQIRARSTVASTDLKIVTYGWIDTRGRA